MACSTSRRLGATARGTSETSSRPLTEHAPSSALRAPGSRFWCTDCQCEEGDGRRHVRGVCRPGAQVVDRGADQLRRVPDRMGQDVPPLPLPPHLRRPFIPFAAGTACGTSMRRAASAPSTSSATRRSKGATTTRFSARTGRSATPSPAGRTRARSSKTCSASTPSRISQASLFLPARRLRLQPRSLLRRRRLPRRRRVGDRSGHLRHPVPCRQHGRRLGAVGGLRRRVSRQPQPPRPNRHPPAAL